jgi:hypothetical protein
MAGRAAALGFFAILTDYLEYIRKLSKYKAICDEFGSP